MAKIRPHGRRLLVKVDKIIEEEVDGIILPENRRELPKRGVVVDIGFGGDIPLCAKIGERVIFPAQSGATIKIDDEDFVVIDDADIEAVLEYEDE